MTKKKGQNRNRTWNDMLRYVYHEALGPGGSRAVREAVFSDPWLEEEFYGLVALKGDLDRLGQGVSPSEASIERILEFSRSLDSVEQ